MGIINSHGDQVIAEIANSRNPVYNSGVAKAPQTSGCLLKVKTDGIIKYRLVGNPKGDFDEDYFFKGDTTHERVIEVDEAGTSAEFKFVY